MIKVAVHIYLFLSFIIIRVMIDILKFYVIYNNMSNDIYLKILS